MIKKPGRLGSSWWKRGALITPDANTVAHVIFRGGSLQDSRGNAWTQNGTVPQSSAIGAVPPSAGVFSDANYYSLGTGSDVLDFAGDFTICVVFSGPMGAIDRVMFANTNGGNGYDIHTPSATTKFTLLCRGGTAASTANSAAPNAINVGCAGRSGGNALVQLNSGSLVTQASAYTQNATSVARLGRYESAGVACTDVLLYEFYATSTAASGALFSSLITQAFQRMKLPVP